MTIWKLPDATWATFTDKEKVDYLYILRRSTNHGVIDESVFALMSDRVKLAAKQLFKSIIDNK